MAGGDRADRGHCQTEKKTTFYGLKLCNLTSRNRCSQVTILKRLYDVNGVNAAYPCLIHLYFLGDQSSEIFFLLCFKASLKIFLIMFQVFYK